jgi:hypothetical protein
LTTTRHVRLRTVALPVEHGAWGFLLEPALLGLLVAWSGAGVALVVAALAALLLQTPLTLALGDLRRGRTYPRTRLAVRVAMLYALALVVALATAIVSAGTAAILVPALLAVPLALTHLWFDAYGRARGLVPETAGALAMNALVACIAVAAGWGLVPALGLWVLLAARTVPTIVYVRARLRLERGREVSTTWVWVTQVAAVAGVAVAVVRGDLAWFALAPFALLTARAAVGVSSARVSVPAKVIGFRELGFGVATAVLLSIAL